MLILRQSRQRHKQDALLRKWNGIDVIGGNDINGGYWVVQIEGTRMMAARTRDGVSWNERAVLNKTIETGKPVSGAPAAVPGRPAGQPASRIPVR